MALNVDQEVRILGKLKRGGVLLASLIIIGDVLDMLGEVTSSVDSLTKYFCLTTFSNEEVVVPYQAHVEPAKTLISADCNMKVDMTVI